jgi:hypothetical protein
MVTHRSSVNLDMMRIACLVLMGKSARENGSQVKGLAKLTKSLLWLKKRNNLKSRILRLPSQIPIAICSMAVYISIPFSPGPAFLILLVVTPWHSCHFS